jgi:thymidylate synthase
MQTYLDLVREVMDTGVLRQDRTGVGTLSVFGVQKKYDLRDGFPLLTTKKIKYSSVVHELLWFLRGATNIHDGLTQYTPIWDPWAGPDGDLGPIYGYQWRHWEAFSPTAPHSTLYQKHHIDQISVALHLLKTDPFSRRIIVTAWNPADISKMALPPCHSFFQFYVVDKRLDLQLYQRAADIALGVPYNIASYATLLTMFAKECGYEPGIFVHTIGDAHIYLNHQKGLREQLTRTPRPLPTLTTVAKSLFEYTPDDLVLDGYDPHPFIPFKVAV